MSNPKRIETHNAILPAKAPGCGWESWGGAFGLSEKLRVFDTPCKEAFCEIGNANDLTPRSRRALADYMMKLWDRFGRGEVCE